MIVILDGDVNVNALTVLLLVLVCREVGAEDEIVEAVEVCRHRVVAVWVVPHLWSPHAHAHTHTHTHTQTCIRTCMHTCTHACTNIDMHTYEYTQI